MKPISEVEAIKESDFKSQSYFSKVFSWRFQFGTWSGVEPGTFELSVGCSAIMDRVVVAGFVIRCGCNYG